MNPVGFNIFKNALLLLALIFNAQLAIAQTPPDAGVLRQQIEQGIKPVQPAPSIPSKAAPLQKLAGATVVIKAFKFIGNTRISTAVLQSVVVPYLNRPLDFAQLQDAAVAVGNAYREAGWIVRAYLPQQEIEDGVVTIEVVEAVLGAVRFEGAPSKRISYSAIQQYVDAAQKVGEPLNALAVDRALLLLSDIPGVAVTGSLHEGRSSGQTDLVLRADDRPVLGGDAAIDNTGSRSTGNKRVSGNLNLNSPLGRGDQLSTNLMFTEGSNYVRLAFSMPVEHDGWRVGASGSYMAYRLVAPEFKALAATGSSSSYGLDASYPIIRSRLKNLYLALNYDHKFFNNDANRSTTTRYVSDTFSIGLNSNLVDRLWGGGMNSLGMTWVYGTTDLNGSPNQAADAASTRADGHFNKLRYSASRLQTVTETIAAYAAISGQMSNKNLDSGEKFYLGGGNGVRAYPSSEGGGTDGQLVNIELRARLPHEVGLTGFFDWGHVTVNRNNSFIGAPVLNNYSLQGFGVALGLLTDLGVNLKATWARRIGNNPNPTATGNDQDGTLYKNRLWLQASMGF